MMQYLASKKGRNNDNTYIGIWETRRDKGSDQYVLLFIERLNYGVLNG